jgi:hypothetical protein
LRSRRLGFRDRDLRRVLAGELLAPVALVAAVEWRRLRRRVLAQLLRS